MSYCSGSTRKSALEAGGHVIVYLSRISSSNGNISSREIVTGPSIDNTPDMCEEESVFDGKSQRRGVAVPVQEVPSQEAKPYEKCDRLIRLVTTTWAQVQNDKCFSDSFLDYAGVLVSSVFISYIFAHSTVGVLFLFLGMCMLRNQIEWKLAPWNPPRHDAIWKSKFAGKSGALLRFQISISFSFSTNRL